MMKVEEYKHQPRPASGAAIASLSTLTISRVPAFPGSADHVRYAFNLYSPHGLLHTALAELDGKLELLPSSWTPSGMHLCGGCDIRCKRNLDVEVLQVIETLRQRCVEKGKGPCPP